MTVIAGWTTTHPDSSNSSVAGAGGATQLRAGGGFPCFVSGPADTVSFTFNNVEPSLIFRFVFYENDSRDLVAFSDVLSGSDYVTGQEYTAPLNMVKNFDDALTYRAGLEYDYDGDGGQINLLGSDEGSTFNARYDDAGGSYDQDFSESPPDPEPGSQSSSANTIRPRLFVSVTEPAVTEGIPSTVLKNADGSLATGVEVTRTITAADDTVLFTATQTTDAETGALTEIDLSETDAEIDDEVTDRVEPTSSTVPRLKAQEFVVQVSDLEA
ncbi:MAG: hypothetical protein LAT50_12110 [Ectothiorhodospiraceae bacterium]|nr:hypothetical protein [Ectothiorhodospiraceae bacterium]